ncbi:MAG: hypothetical protein M5U12_38345 [Verrucomicrobia bacterium]|nr:hypothetical protein [Verrucomicrobiota bacterium]
MLSPGTVPGSAYDQEHAHYVVLQNAKLKVELGQLTRADPDRGGYHLGTELGSAIAGPDRLHQVVSVPRGPAGARDRGRLKEEEDEVLKRLHAG